MRLPRRALLRGGVLALGIEPRGVLGPLWELAQGRAGSWVDEAHAEPISPKLSASELDDLIAFAEPLVEGRPLSPAERAGLVENIADRVAREADYLQVYRTTVNLLRRLAGRPFARLAMAERIDLIARYRLNSPDARPGDDRGPFAGEVRQVRMRARADLIADYYGSPAGWAVVGYAAFPGRCGDLLRYTRPEA